MAHRPGRRIPRRGLLAVCAAVTLGFTGCAAEPAAQSGTPASAPTSSTKSTPDAPADPAPAVEQVDLQHYPESSTFTEIPEAPRDPAPQEPTSGVVLRVKRDMPVYESPDGPVFARLPAQEMNSDTWVPIIEQRDGWARVLLPSRPNGSTGWVPTNDPASTTKARSAYEVDVDVDERNLVIRRDGEQLGEWTVGVGSTDSPTPRGRTYVMSAIADDVIDYSPVVLPLGAHSDTYSTYGGGPGTVAFHGWPDPGVFGQASSDGCVRVPDDLLRTLQKLPLGTPVMLR